ncbi:MAG: WD40 repeat domain-containing protein, partial [Ktedonobacteraceae bacterium]
GHTASVSAVAWSPDGKQIASASYDKTAQISNAMTGSSVFTYKSHSDWVFSIGWSPDGRYLVSSAADKTAQVWSIA